MPFLPASTCACLCLLQPPPTGRASWGRKRQISRLLGRRSPLQACGSRDDGLRCGRGAHAPLVTGSGAALEAGEARAPPAGGLYVRAAAAAARPGRRARGCPGLAVAARPRQHRAPPARPAPASSAPRMSPASGADAILLVTFDLLPVERSPRFFTFYFSLFFLVEASGLLLYGERQRENNEGK